jgi:signal transduction histidine kinase
LAAAVTKLTQQFQHRTGIQPLVIWHCPPLPPALEVTVYRILQEALTNACKYSHAKRLTITAETAQPKASHLHLSVQDDGKGFDPTALSTGFGLRGMQERAEAEGGRFQLTSRIGKGTRIQVWLPLGCEQP